MAVDRIVGEQLLAKLQRHAGVALAAVPVRMIFGELAELRNLIRFSLQLLQAHDVGLLAIQPLPELGSAGADAVDVPGSDFHTTASREVDACELFEFVE